LIAISASLGCAVKLFEPIHWPLFASCRKRYCQSIADSSIGSEMLITPLIERRGSIGFLMLVTLFGRRIVKLKDIVDGGKAYKDFMKLEIGWRKRIFG